MKKLIFSEILKGLQNKPHLFKKLKILAVFGVLSVFLVGGFAIYLSVVGVRYIANVGKEVNVLEHAETLRSTLGSTLGSKVENLPVLARTDCLAAAQKLLSFDALLGTPIQENIQILKEACLEKSTEGEAKSKEVI